MVIVTDFNVGDIVKVGPHDNARIIQIRMGGSLTYLVQWWDENGEPHEYSAYDWEIQLIEGKSLREGQ